MGCSQMHKSIYPIPLAIHEEGFGVGICPKIEPIRTDMGQNCKDTSKFA